MGTLLSQQFTERKDAFVGASIPWLREARKQGIDHFSEVGFPTVRDEHWKYTNVSPIEKHEFKLADDQNSAIKKQDLEAFRFNNLETNELIFVNGKFSSELSQFDQNDGVVLENMSDWLANKADQDLSIKTNDNVFASLNNAFMTDGAVLHISKNISLEKPVHLIFVSTKTDEKIMSYPRIDIRLEANAAATLIESYVYLSDEDNSTKNFTNTLTNIVAGPNSQLEHYRIQQESLGAYHIGNIHIDQQKDSRVTSHSISLGASIARVDIKVKLSEAGSENVLNGLFMGKGRQHTDHHILADHLSPHTRSEEYFKGIMDDGSRGVFNGKVIVHEDAQKIEAIQSNKNLLLSPHAEVDTKPELEIYADDVKCAHGATIGRLNDAELFYLQSRGISAEKAIALLTYAFADDVINRMNIAPVREYLEQKIVGQLSSLENIKDLV
ncbi:MAG: Fe-S cluster assembly protein SufD [Gammaproteobacteria bacterium]